MAESPPGTSAGHVSGHIEGVDLGTIASGVTGEDSPDSMSPAWSHAPVAGAAEAAHRALPVPSRGHHSRSRDRDRLQLPFFLRHRFHGRAVHLMGLADCRDAHDRARAAAAAAVFPRVLRCLLASTRALVMLETYGEKALGRLWQDQFLPELATIARLAWQETGRELGEPRGGVGSPARFGLLAVLAVRNHLLVVRNGHSDGLLLRRPADAGSTMPLEHCPLSAGSSACEDGGIVVTSHVLHYSSHRWCVLGSRCLWDRVTADVAAHELDRARDSADAVQALLERAKSRREPGGGAHHGATRFATAAVLGIAECATMSAGAADLA